MFMEPRIEFGLWSELENEHGESAFVPAEYRADLEADGLRHVETQDGWGARLSANGYMDCTEWTVHETEARSELAETYFSACDCEECEDCATYTELVGADDESE